MDEVTGIERDENTFLGPLDGLVRRLEMQLGGGCNITLSWTLYDNLKNSAMLGGGEIRVVRALCMERFWRQVGREGEGEHQD